MQEKEKMVRNKYICLFLNYNQILCFLVCICCPLNFDLLLLLFAFVALKDITTVDSLQFDFSTIEAATNKFSDDSKLGEGGFGVVYKVWNCFALLGFFLFSNTIIT